MDKRLPNVLLSDIAQEATSVFENLVPDDVMDQPSWTYLPRKPNYDKQLLLDFIEWLSEKHNISLAQDLDKGFSERIVEYEFVGLVDQYLEDDE